MIHQEYYTAIIKGVQLREAGPRCRVHATRTSCAVSVHLFIFIFLIPVGTSHLAVGQRVNGGRKEVGREGARGKRARRDTVELPWRFTLPNKRLVSGR